MNFFTQLISDADGRISSSRLLNVLIGVCSCLIMWKLALVGGLTDTIWGLWLAYGGGTYGWSKMMETKRPIQPKPEAQ